MREGRLVAEFSHSEVSEERIVAAATGQTEIAEKRATTDRGADHRAQGQGCPGGTGNLKE
jgi:hypothetical protein